MLSLVPKVGLESLLKACRLSADSGLYNDLSVTDILKNKQDELPVKDWDSGETGIVTPEHEEANTTNRLMYGNE